MWQVYTAEIRKMIAYRADFWIQYLFNIFAHLGVAYFLWAAVWSAKGHPETVKEFTFRGMMFYYLLVPLVSRVIFGSEFGAMSREIYDGALTKYLIYPVSFFRYKFMQYLAHSTVYFFQMVLGVSIFFLFFGVPDELVWSTTIPLLFITLFLSAMMNFALTTTLELFAFWADNVWTLLVMVRFSVGLLGGGLIPLVFFPEQFEMILRLLPFVYLTAFPVDMIMGKVGFELWWISSLITLCWIGLFIVSARLVWRRGNLKYTGVGI